MIVWATASMLVRLAMAAVNGGNGYCVVGNHDLKLVKALRGRKVQISRGLAESLEQLGRESDAFRAEALKFLDGLASLRSPFNILMVFVTSVIIWLLETVKYWFVMHAFTFTVSFFALMLLNGIANLATTIPSAPGYIGTWEAVTKAVLMAFNVSGAEALGYGVVLHVALWLPVTLVGAYFMAREGIKWSDSMRSEAAAGDENKENNT